MPKIAGKGVAIEKGLRATTRKITKPASVYGAGKEKAINATLEKYLKFFKGSPQQQYEGLQPAMQEIEGKIGQFIAKNPAVSASKEAIKKSFIKNLASSLRSKDLTQKQAITEINGYLTDLLKASGGTGKFTNIPLTTLRNLKKLVNADYGPVHKILERGTGALNPRQKVIAAAWDSLDDAVKSASPTIKTLLTDESNLYKAAQSLSSARVNPPTFRVMGTSVPAWATQTGRDVIGGVFGKTGQALSSPIARTAGKMGAQAVGQVGARTFMPSVPEELGNEGQQGYSQNNNQQGFQQRLPPISQGTSMTGQSQTLSDIGQDRYPIENYIQDITRDSKNAAIYDKIFKAYHKDQKPYTSQQIKDITLANNGLTGLNVVKQELGYNSRTGTIGSGGTNKILKMRLTPLKLGSRKLYNAMFDAMGARLRIETGAQINEQEIRRYLDEYFLRLGDDPTAIAYQIQSLDRFLTTIATQPQASSDIPSLPDIGQTNFSQP